MGTFEWIATAAFGLEGLVAKELKPLGIRDAKGEIGGARFNATFEQAYKANLWLRYADRVLLVVKEWEALSFEDLFQGVKAIPWEELLPKDAVFPIKGKCVKSQLMSVSDCQSITKKAIVERLKEKYHQNWFEETGALYPIEISITQNIARITIDTSGNALNKRGYRTWNAQAPLRETLAAALVHLSGWRQDTPFYDPCCGGGTLLIEAAMMAANQAPGLYREFACEKWPLLNHQAAALLREEALAVRKAKNLPPIMGSDIDGEALSISQKHIRQAHLEGAIKVEDKNLFSLSLPYENGTLITNPPYGERMSDIKEIQKIYRRLGTIARENPLWSCNVITSFPSFERAYGKKAAKKRRFYNGRLECNYYMYPVNR